ncbi:NeuD/PglB/VioB family sugar acetyltransferase [Adhaeribacter rhizoryzae]|uniref:PglD N-terminal domain-containing protein n=1 Tax=Adhaeribacter rhizoryzae TaxID=2607907 RepID=A0A5M6DPK0_9BACT|nr:NeuD/PglB/VioB family sugar acetyltransferase [Adhaeribacter rhizoryzae]KAA5548326.1 hypothetical protein F0145_06250 [Adhaeribacter rhizoryzae]
MLTIAIIGAGVLGQHIAHYINQSNNFRAVGFYDDYQKPGAIISDLPVLGSTEAIDSGFKAKVFDELIMGIGYNHLLFRQQLYDHFKTHIPFATYISPFAYVDYSITIGQGVVILPGCVFDKNVQVENNIFFNIGCLISHDSVIKSNSFFAPGVKISGFVTVGERCFLGIGTTIINNVNLSSDIQTGGGTVVISDIDKPGLYAGTPAKYLKDLIKIK